MSEDEDEVMSEDYEVEEVVPEGPRKKNEDRTKAPNAPCNRFFKCIRRGGKNGGQWQCRHCKHQLAGRRYIRFHTHITKMCGKISEKRRNEYIEEVNRVGIRGDGELPPAEGEKPAKVIFQDDDSGTDSEIDDKEEAVKILTGLLSKVKKVANKKPLSQYSDADFEREKKELEIREARLRCKELEDRSKFYDKVSSQMSTISMACDLFIQDRCKGAQNPINILEQAFEESINSPTDHRN